MRNADHGVKEKGRYVGAVPAVVGGYAAYQTIGSLGSGEYSQSFMGITVQIENIPAGSVIELWLRQVEDGTLSADQMDPTNYFYAGLVCVPARVAYTATGEVASYGSATWTLAGYPGAQLRVKNASGGGGSATFSWTAF